MLVLSSISFLSVILFFVSLSVLVVIHELGHLSMAKLFKVYCFEFSIGFGPALFQRKKAGRETTFSLRAIPLGGYVSMYGESETLPEGLEVPPERSLLKIKKWKRAIIMGAGIFLNFVLGYALFAANTIFFPQVIANNQITVSEYLSSQEETQSPAYAAGLRTGDKVVKVEKQFLLNGLRDDVNYPSTSYDVETYSDLWEDALTSISPQTLNDQLSITLYWVPFAEIENENPTIQNNTFILDAIKVSETKEEVFYGWSKIGIGNYQARIGFGEALARAGSDWWESATIIAKTLGQLFVGKGFENVGGPIAILSVSSDMLQYGFGYYLMLWAMISVNLGIFNLLPFPGLDGWHLLVVAIEGIFHKEIPSKVKNTISTIGMLILFALMAVVFIKDIWGLFGLALI